MKSLKTLAATLIACATIQAASAAVVLVEFTPNSTGPLGASLTFEGFPDGPAGPLSVLSGATLSYNNATIVQAVGNNQGAVPFPASGDYLSIKAGGLATFNFADVEDYFAFQWGSIDAYNTISFFLGAVNVGSFTGSDVVSSPVAANGNQGFNGSAYVGFAGLFDKVVLTSTQNSFEIDNVSVPDAGSSLALVGLGFLALAGFARRRRA